MGSTLEDYVAGAAEAALFQLHARVDDYTNVTEGILLGPAISDNGSTLAPASVPFIIPGQVRYPYSVVFLNDNQHRAAPMISVKVPLTAGHAYRFGVWVATFEPLTIYDGDFGGSVTIVKQ